MTASLAQKALTAPHSDAIETPSNFIFREGHNCWRHSKADFATPLIDYANYYRALHQSISKAQHSIFIVGWDIDSRIRLLRGAEEDAANAPVIISELIRWKAERNPSLKVYLLRWDSSIVFLKTRELWAREVWEYKTPPNVYTMLDDTIPMGGSQHQKIVLIDDEIAFTGGMDITLKRWDTREHRFDEPNRTDDSGTYGPFHDVQVVTSGPVVREFAELVRWRWNQAAAMAAVDIREQPIKNNGAPPATWPQSFAPLFCDIQCAIARTIPPMENVEPVHEVKRMLIDLIGQATDFIYIENQYATRMDIAEALNHRLRACKTLRVMILSTYSPVNKFECEAYWASRIDFKRILEKGVRSHRVALTHSSAYDEKKNFYYKRIHSKLMVIDSNYLVIGSSNLNNRSMSLDTECDLIFSASSDTHRRHIESVRNDLLAEHSGRSIGEVEGIFQQRHVIKHLMKRSNCGHYFIAPVKDGSFTDRRLQGLFRFLSDPERPLISPIRWLKGERIVFRNPGRKSLFYGLAIIALTLAVGYYALTQDTWPMPSSEQVNNFLQLSRDSAWAIPAVVLIYMVGSVLFFPATIISLAVCAVFGPLWGPVYGTLGALVSTAFMFSAGRLLGRQSLRLVGGVNVEVVSNKIRHSKLFDVVAIRFIPIAPFNLVNLVAGIASVNLPTFLIGTLIGLLPSMFAKGWVGDAITGLYLHPSFQTCVYFAVGIAVWIALLFISQRFARYYQQNKYYRQQKPA